jgi:hypothetical protein
MGWIGKQSYGCTVIPLFHFVSQTAMWRCVTVRYVGLNVLHVLIRYAVAQKWKTCLEKFGNNSKIDGRTPEPEHSNPLLPNFIVIL